MFLEAPGGGCRLCFRFPDFERVVCGGWCMGHQGLPWQRRMNYDV